MPLKNHFDKAAPISTIAFVSAVWRIITTVAGMLVERKEKLYIHPSHNIPDDIAAQKQLSQALNEYTRRIAGV